MARIRTIKPSFFKNEDLAELPVAARLLFIGLWCLADKEGRLEDRPKRIKAELFPYENLEVDQQLSRLQSAGFIKRINGIIKIMPKDCLGIKRSFSILDNDTKEWIKIRHIIFNRDGKECRYCGTDKPPFQIDHIIPISKGGTDELANLAVACRKCNVRKKDLDLTNFLNKYTLHHGTN